MKILVTGAAGFIGQALCLKLLQLGDEVIGIDNLNEYYDLNLKRARLDFLNAAPNFKFILQDISDRETLTTVFKQIKPQVVVNLAAQAGIRHSISHPQTFIDTNLVGFANILDGCRQNNIQHLIYATSSSVYGLNHKLPYSTHDLADHPISLYAATKRANELLAHSYSHSFQLPTTALRFFTVYGPWGRPDMAPFLFAKNILSGIPIQVFNEGKHQRDFTYISDIVEGLLRVIQNGPSIPSNNWNPRLPDPSISSAPFRVYNIGNGNSVGLLQFIEILEKCLGKKANKILIPKQQCEMENTLADDTDFRTKFNFQTSISVEVGVRLFAQWYREFYGI